MKKKKLLWISFICLFISISCKSKNIDSSNGWHNDAIIYHLWIKSFADSNDNDKIGDFNGIIEKLDYLNDGDPKTGNDLGINTIWLSPFFEPGLKSTDPDVNMHGYDPVNYYKINSIFGDEILLKKLINEAHKRGIKLIYDFMPNHCSTKHKWFLDSMQDKDKRDWFVWNDDPSDEGWINAWGYGGTWKDVWKKANKSYYYSAFRVSSLADLNLKNSDVVDEMNNVLKFWLDKGFDGVRVDAVRYLIEDGPLKTADRPDSHEILKEMRKIVDSYKVPKVMILEAWTDKLSKMKEYYGNGKDEAHMCLDFDFAKAVPQTVSGIDSLKVNDLLVHQQKEFPQGYKSASFLSNHDNVVSRPFSLYFKDTKKCILAAALNILGPGSPVIYYGNEIGMSGESGNDENLRTFFNWKMLESQKSKPDSIYNWYRYLIMARNKYIALRRGAYIPVESSEFNVQAFVRSYKDENILVVINPGNSKKGIVLDFENIKVSGKTISTILGDVDITKEKSLLTIKLLPEKSVTIVHFGENKQKKIYGNSQIISR